MNGTDVMIDLETFGLKTNAPIVQIGAAAFDRDTGVVGRTFFRNILIDSALRSGEADGETVAWWLSRGRAARESLLEDPVGMPTALMDLRTFIADLETQGVVRPWACGSTFDIAKLEYQYEVQHEQHTPWAFHTVRDVRTVEDLSPLDRDAALALSSWEQKGETQHNALSDCRYQIAFLVPMLCALGGGQ